jgi:energy-converting hydrogenase Eha subunit C
MLVLRETAREMRFILSTEQYHWIVGAVNITHILIHPFIVVMFLMNYLYNIHHSMGDTVSCISLLLGGITIIFYGLTLDVLLDFALQAAARARQTEEAQHGEG